MSDKRRYSVIGINIEKSFSPDIHAMFAVELGLPVEYGLCPVQSREVFVPTVREYFAQGGSGMNVTMPFKPAAVALADDVSSGATRAGAANTLKHSDGIISACNTDGPGFIRDLCKRLQFEVADARVLILGAGGACAGITVPLLEKEPQLVCIANRTTVKGVALAERFAPHAKDSELVATGLNDVLLHAPYALVINATSAGHTNQMPQLPVQLFDGVQLAYDATYGVAADGFLRQASNAGVPRCVDGMGMVVEQAAFAFAFWEGVMPATEPVYAELKRRKMGWAGS